MEPLLAILRAAHCRSTHHYFAIDALRRVRTPAGERLSQLLLKYHRAYLQGAKDPDTQFRDFQNHVLHVADNNWGGATDAAKIWYRKFLEHLREGRPRDAAHAAGVLSHYFTDPFQPLHTAQSDREAALHRPIEWSICCCYDDLLRRSMAPELEITFFLGQGGNWLREAIQRGAELAHRYYEPLMDQYDLARATDPYSYGLNFNCRELLSELFAVVLTGWACVIDRLASEAEVELQEVPLSLATVMAGVQLPTQWIVKRLSQQTERRAVAAILNEYRATGTVKDHLPEEVKSVRATREQAEAVPATPAIAEATVTPPSDAAAKPRGTRKRKPTTEPTKTTEEPIRLLLFPRSRLAESSQIVDAPSIGPKTAARLNAAGIETVGEFLAADAKALAKQLKTSWITEALLGEWQRQAKLKLQVESLRVTEIQLIVAAGIATAATLARANPKTLLAKVTEYAKSSNGRRLLRGAQPPNQADIQRWIEAASTEREKSPTTRKRKKAA